MQRMLEYKPAVHCREAAAKERLALLKANDSEAYLKLVRSAKNSRLNQLLGQTDACLNNLAARLRLKTKPLPTSGEVAAEKEGMLAAAAFRYRRHACRQHTHPHGPPVHLFQMSMYLTLQKA